MARVPLVQDDDEAARAGGIYEWSHHRPMALAAGVTADQAAALAAWRESALFSPAERLIDWAPGLSPWR